MTASTGRSASKNFGTTSHIPAGTVPIPRCKTTIFLTCGTHAPRGKTASTVKNTTASMRQTHAANMRSSMIRLATSPRSMYFLFMTGRPAFRHDSFMHVVGFIQLVLEASIHWGQFPTRTSRAKRICFARQPRHRKHRIASDDRGLSLRQRKGAQLYSGHLFHYDGLFLLYLVADG